MPAAGSQGPHQVSLGSWGRSIGGSLHQTTPSIVTVSLFPCLAVLIITPGSQTKKRATLKRKEWGKCMRGSFFLLRFPLFFLSTNIVLFVVSLGIMCGFCGNVNLLCCFESVRTVCDVQHQCHLLCEEFGSMLKLWHRQVQHEHRQKEFLFMLYRGLFVEIYNDLKY